MVYSRSKIDRISSFYCGVRENESDLVPEEPINSDLQRADDGQFRTYRLALACTIEYAAYHVSAAGVGGGTIAQRKAAVLAAMNVTMTRVNGVYERDMSLTMQIIPNNDVLINITSDSYDNSNINNILFEQNQTQVDNLNGTANYEFGNVCRMGGCGVAQFGVVY